MGMNAQVVFDSRDEMFKKPAGAVKEGTVTLFRLLTARSLGVKSAELQITFDKDSSMRTFGMEAGETPVETDDFLMYTVSVPMEKRGLYWYSFILHTDGSDIHVNRSDADNRAVMSYAPGLSWQQTVYRRDYEVPEWIEGGVFYHIFVDRFNHSGPYAEMEGKITRRDWGGVPEYRPDSEGRILNNDFFGGNLKGVTEKLPYIHALGATCIFLSPVFKAFSSHKYDTEDYMTVDPMFGTEEDLSELCAKAGELGMRVILDGVFAHTGSDSIYFDKQGKNASRRGEVCTFSDGDPVSAGGEEYAGDACGENAGISGPRDSSGESAGAESPEKGAWGNPDSPYRDWYYFRPDGSYEAWWGIDTLPKVNKSSESYREFICGENGVARKWLRAGASGWRLDVADELPNDFLKILAKAVKTEKPDALFLGEVWEDASNKIAYSERKNYFEGDKLDSVMNYPFKDAVIDFVRNGNAAAIARTVESIVENYPKDVVDCLMNVLGTHDTVRILTALGGRDLGPDPDRELQAATRMDQDERRLAVRKLKTACVIQMTLPGVPCVYYGDEAGVEGYKDPFNRTCYPWGNEDRDILNWYKKVIAFRRSHDVYKKGSYRTMAAIGGIYAFERFDENEENSAVITAANAGGSDEKLILSGTWRDALTGEVYRGNITLFPGQVLLLTPAGSK